MSKDEVERIDDQGMAAWGSHDADAITALLADDFVWADVTLQEPLRTKEEARQYAQAWFTAFPDMNLKQTNRVVSDDAVFDSISAVASTAACIAAFAELARL